MTFDTRNRFGISRPVHLPSNEHPTDYRVTVRGQIVHVEMHNLPDLAGACISGGSTLGDLQLRFSLCFVINNHTTGSRLTNWL